VRRDLTKYADLQVEELDQSNQVLSGKHDVYPSEGRVVIVVYAEGCIQTLTEEFLVTSDKNAPDLSIGRDLGAKFERLRSAIRSYPEMREHHRYEGGPECVSGNSELGSSLRPRNRTNNSLLPDEEPSRRYPYTPPSLQSPDIDQQGSEIPGRLAGVDEKSPLITRRRLPISSEPHSSSNANDPLRSIVTRSTTTDAPVHANQTGTMLPANTVPVTSGHETSNDVILRLTKRNVLVCGAGVIFSIVVTSLLSVYLVRRWDISPREHYILNLGHLA
jgi:hypothetical protein